MNSTKILIIILVSVYLIGNFIPYYEERDAYLYGLVATNLSNGEFSITNDLLQDTGRIEFVGGNWLKTVHNTAVPIGGIGLPIIGAIFYTIAGHFGLFYLIPIFTILLLIASDRIVTSLFGKYVGFLTLLIVASSNLLLRNSQSLQTESIFALFFILGTFYLIKYLKEKRDFTLILASTFFVIGTFIRIGGIIVFPIEIGIIVGYFSLLMYRRKKSSNNLIDKINKKTKISFLRLVNKSSLKGCIILLVPWMVFFIFWFSFYGYYFDEPLTNYREISHKYNEERHGRSNIASLISIDKQDFENIKQYSKYSLPYQITAIYNNAEHNYDNVFSKNWLGVIFLIILSSILLTSLYFKVKRLEIIVFVILILGIIWFYSSVTTEERAQYGVPGRYIIPGFILSSALFGISITSLIKIDWVKNKLLKNFQTGLKILFVAILIVFFLLAFYYSPSIQSFVSNYFEIKNPWELTKIYPRDLEGLTTNSVILSYHGDRVLDYGVILFIPASQNQIPKESIELLDQILIDGYNVYVFKDPIVKNEKERINQMVENHGFVLKDFSSSFCKLEKSSPDKSEFSDEVCLE